MNGFDDNILVGKTNGKYPSRDFLQIVFREPDDIFPSSVSLSRYTVPGRIDSYNFDYVEGGSGMASRLRYSSESDLPLTKALSMLAKDLDKKQVVELIVDACSREGHFQYARILNDCILRSIAPKSKSYRALDKVIKERFAEIKYRHV
jgi:hypothetical protein